jgi:hypothetical protein
MVTMCSVPGSTHYKALQTCCALSRTPSPRVSIAETELTIPIKITMHEKNCLISRNHTQTSDRQTTVLKELVLITLEQIKQTRTFRYTLTSLSLSLSRTHARARSHTHERAHARTHTSELHDTINLLIISGTLPPLAPRHIIFNWQ